MSWFSRRNGAPPASSHEPPEPDEPQARLAAIEARIVGNVSNVVIARVTRIATTVRATLPRLDQLGMGSAQAYAVVQTATSYLPEALGAYMRLPRGFADTRAVSDGKTSLMVLCDQLDLLANKMDEVFDAVCRADADALIAHGRFLNEKFGRGSLDTVNGSASSTAGSAAERQLTPPNVGGL